MMPPTLDTPRLRLRAITPADADALFGIFSDAETLRFWNHTAFTEPSQADTLVADIAARSDTGDLLKWGIEVRESGVLVGTATLVAIDRSNRRAEVGFLIGRAFWGHGYGGEAMRALIGHAFGGPDVGGIGLRRLEADVDPLNAASLRVLERLGFQREGLLRERWRVGGGVQDTVMLGLLASEWDA